MTFRFKLPKGRRHAAHAPEMPHLLVDQKGADWGQCPQSNMSLAQAHLNPSKAEPVLDCRHWPQRTVALYS